MLPNFAVLPPEVNSARVFAGAGSAPMLAAAAAWDDLASELHCAAMSFGSVTSGLVVGGRRRVALGGRQCVVAPRILRDPEPG